jgi:hypothetical protein
VREGGVEGEETKLGSAADGLNEKGEETSERVE